MPDDEPAAPEPAKRQNGLPNDRQIRLILILAGAGLGLYLCYRLAIPFLPSLTWAAVLSVIFAPAHRRIETSIQSPSFAALVSVAAVTVLVAVPAALVADRLIHETARSVIYLESELRSGEWLVSLESTPLIGRAARWIGEVPDLAGAAGSFASMLTTLSTSLLRSSLGNLINLVLTFYLLFYFLRDRQHILRTLHALSPLGTAGTHHVIGRVADTIHATVLGTFGVAAVQGTLSGLMFWWLGLPLPLLWGTVMGMLAIVPVLGAFVIWVPAAIYLALEGEWLKAMILAAWGGGVVAGIDNLLYPMLVGNRLRLHTAVALIGTFGGILLFGASGLILGPAIIAVTLALVEILKRRFNGDGKVR